MDSFQSPHLPECHDLRQDEDGHWHAVHKSGREVHGATWEEIVADAMVVRVTESLREEWT